MYINIYMARFYFINKQTNLLQKEYQTTIYWISVTFFLLTDQPSSP